MSESADTATAAELAALRAEIERLERRRTDWWRPLVSGVLIVLLAVAAPASVLAQWMHNEIADTDRYVESIEPLAADPAIQDAVTTLVTDEIMSRLQIQAVAERAVDALADRGLPRLAATSLKTLATPLSEAIGDFVADHVRDIVESDRFAQAWVETNRQAHVQLVSVLTGEGSELVDVSGTTVSLNLGPVLDAVKQRLVDAGFDLAAQLPRIDLQLTLFESDDLTRAQILFRLLEDLNNALPIVGLLLLAAAVAVGRSRRGTLIAAMIAIATSMVLLGVTLNAFRLVYLGSIPSSTLPIDAATAFYDHMVASMHMNLRAVIVLSLAVAFIAWVSGPSHNAVVVRRDASTAVAWARGGRARLGLDTGRLGVFLDTYRTIIRVVVLGGTLLVYVMSDHPSGSRTLTLLVVAGVILLVTELLARPADDPAGDPADSGSEHAAESDV